MRSQKLFIAILLLCSLVGYAPLIFSEPLYVEASTSPNGFTPQPVSNNSEHSTLTSDTEIGLFFTYGYSIPYIMTDNRPDGAYTSLIGLTLNFIVPLDSWPYMAFFHSISNKFYGSFISSHQFDTTASSGQKEVDWDISYTFGVRLYLGSRIFFMDAGAQVALLFRFYSINHAAYDKFAFHGVVGLGLDFPIQPDFSIQTAFHYLLPMTTSYKYTSLKGFIFDLGFNWKV